MKIKNFDFFQKVTIDNATQPTICGSILSLTAISLIIILFIREVIIFYTPQIVTDSIVFQDPNQLEKIKLNLFMKFQNVPCSLLSLDQEDTLRNHKLDISDTIGKFMTSPNDKVPKRKPGLFGVKNFEKMKEMNKRKYDSSKPMNEVDFFKSIENNESCIISGHVDIAKVPGDMHVSFHAYGYLWNLLKISKPELANKVNLAHHIVSLSFGNMEDWKLYKYGINPRSFNRLEKMPDFTQDKTSFDYIYYVKLIPYQFIDENWLGKEEYSYQYSLSFHKREFNDEDDMPIQVIKYEFSPITMRVRILKRDYFHFLTHVCAIIGGIFVIFSLLNKLFVGMI